MISDKLLIKIAVLAIILGFFGLYFFPPNNDNDLMKIRIIEVHNTSKGSFIKFVTNQTYKGYVEGYLKKGEYFVTLSKEGNDFYYINNYKIINGSN